MTAVRGALWPLATAGVALLLMGPARADQPLPFEGTWVRADRVCTAGAASRTYTARTLVTPAGRCTLRKIAFGGGEFEIFEDCHRSERAGSVTEKIRMTGPDTMILKYQVSRLKIPRGRRFARCPAAAPKPAVPQPGRLPVGPAPRLPAPPPVHDPD